MPAARIVSSVQRADSLRSERSDASQANKRVSFNREIDVKHINQQSPQQQQQHPRSSGKGLAPQPPGVSNNVSAVAAALDRHEIPSNNPGAVNNPNLVNVPFYNVYKEPTLLSEAELAQEAERIIQQVDQISCTVSPNPLLANYETRSLERRNLAAAKRNNNQQQQQQNQQESSNGHNWSRTLPTAASTKNQLVQQDTKTGISANNNKKTKNVEKNNILHHQHIQQETTSKLDPIIEASPRRPQQPIMTIDQPIRKQSREAATTPPKYDSGIEMEATSRPNVNLIVQQLTEEARQRELLRRQYQEEMLMTDQDPLAPRLPTLNLIEPDPQFGLTHNKNLPFSYTGGSSPTRISPLRSPGESPWRFASPPPRPEPPSNKSVETARKDVVYAQVNVNSREQSQSPERNLYRSGAADKVPARGKFHFQQQQQQQQSEVIRQHLRYPTQDDEDDDEPEEPVDEEDLDAIKAKARFLFGDDGGQEIRKLSSGSGRGLDARNNNRNGANHHVNTNNNNNSHNNNNNAAGLSFKYSTLLKDRGQQQQPIDPGRSYTTKILIGNEEKQQQQQQRKRQERVFQYSDEDDFGRGRVYKDRSVSPEPRIQPLTSRIRSLQMQASSPERYRGQPSEESRTLPLVNKKTNQQVMASTRLIQEAERGRTVIRTRPAGEFTSSRLVQQQVQQSNRYEDELDGPPKPPLRIKKLSRERMEASPPRVTGNNKQAGKVAFNTVPWNQTDGSESSPERSYPLNRPVSGHNNNNSNNKGKLSSPYRYQPRSITPSPERRIELRRWNDGQLTGQESDTTSARTKGTEPEKQEKIRRQRSKFLSVFLGSKANKSSKTSSTPAPVSSSTAQVVKVPAASSHKSEVRGQAPPVAKWSTEDEAELVRQSRSLLAKGQSHQTTARVMRDAEPPANNKSRPTELQRVTTFHRKTTPPSAVDPRYRVVTNNKDGQQHRRRSSTDRTDTSESDEVNHQRFKNLRQKSQSFNNLNYRPDPMVVLSEEQHQQQQPRRQQHHHQTVNNAGSDWDQEGLDNSQFRSSRRYPDNNNHAEVVTENRYKQQQQQEQQQQQRGNLTDARPYASTNLIHQIGQDRESRPAVTLAEPAQQRRQMRYFGDTDLESQPSIQRGGGGYSSRYQPKAKTVTRSASTAAGMGAVRRGLMQRGQKQAVSSVNSSESDGSAMQSAASAESQRSVYLHATTVADIPTVTPVTNSTRAQQLQAARRKAQSREDMSALSGTTGSTLRRTRQISRSYSVLAPWKPRHYRDKFEITYSNQQQPAMMGQPTAVVDAGKPPRAPVRRREDVIMESEDSADVYRPSVVAQRQTLSKSGTSVSRSSTMPKNSKLMAGWFRKKKQR